MVLLTDGQNNRGAIDPLTGAELARAFGVKVYTILVGRGGVVPVPVDDPLLGRRIADGADGRRRGDAARDRASAPAGASSAPPIRRR